MNDDRDGKTPMRGSVVLLASLLAWLITGAAATLLVWLVRRRP